MLLLLLLWLLLLLLLLSSLLLLLLQLLLLLVMSMSLSFFNLLTCLLLLLLLFMIKLLMSQCFPIGTSAQTEYVVSLGAVDRFVGLLSSPNEEVREQAVWALGNIAGDSPSLRDTCLRSGILPPLLAILDREPKISMTRNLAWVLSNLFRFKPQPRLEDVTPALPVMVDKLLGHGDHEVMADTLWALSYLSDGPNDRIQALLDSGAHM